MNDEDYFQHLDVIPAEPGWMCLIPMLEVPPREYVKFERIPIVGWIVDHDRYHSKKGDCHEIGSVSTVPVIPGLAWEDVKSYPVQSPDDTIYYGLKRYDTEDAILERLNAEDNPMQAPKK